MTSLKLYARYGSIHTPGCAAAAGASGGVAAASATCSSLRLDLHATGVLADPEDHELGRLHRRDADDRDHRPRVDDLGRVGLLIAFHEECFAGCPAHQRAVEPDPREECPDVASDRLPQLAVIRLEDDPPGRLRDRLLDHVEEPPHVEIPPFAGSVREGPGTPNPDALAGEIADAVDAVRVEGALFVTCQSLGHVEGAPDHLVGWSLVHAPGRVAPRPDPGDVTGWSHVDEGAADRVADGDAREVERPEARVRHGWSESWRELGWLVAARSLRAGRRPFPSRSGCARCCRGPDPRQPVEVVDLERRVEDRDSVLHVLAVRDDRRVI